MTARTPITIPEITWTLVAKNIAASKVAVIHDIVVHGQQRTLAQVNATP